MGRTDVAKHAIDLKDEAEPFKSALYRSAPAARELKALGLNKHFKPGVIELGPSDWPAPVLSVSKNWSVAVLQ